MSKALLDTSFLIFLLREKSNLHENAQEYADYLQAKSFHLVVSTIVVGEWCVKSTLEELPLRHIQFLSYNLDHAKQAGLMQSYLHQSRRKIKGDDKVRIQNDIKLFAQAETDKDIELFVTADNRCRAEYDVICSHRPPSFRFIDITLPISDNFGTLF